jgi:hypothetical protein
MLGLESKDTQHLKDSKLISFLSTRFTVQCWGQRVRIPYLAFEGIQTYLLSLNQVYSTMLGLESQDTQHLKDSKLISFLTTRFTAECWGPRVRILYLAFEGIQTYLLSLTQVFNTMLGLASQDTQHLKDSKLISSLSPRFTTQCWG